ncbi:MAG: SIR2 family NAD-dependent protein deacylase [Planctomycetota bacterium]|jgi:NAD-dependent deacetylase
MRNARRTRIVDPGDANSEKDFEDGAAILSRAARVVAFSGAGISVESGIPDFRSPGGLWSRYPPHEYATLDAFLSDPLKVWRLFREMGALILPARPNPAHIALGRLEKAGRLAGVVTQNIDGLHQAGGSERVIELHGDHSSLHCIVCETNHPYPEEINRSEEMPRCPHCMGPLKPNVVLFGEGVRGLEDTARLIQGCDLLLVLGTSAQVYPAAGIPAAVKSEGGMVIEFNLEPTALTHGEAQGLLWGRASVASTDFLFKGPVGETLPALIDRVVF